jgi:6-phosphogluconolactonase
MLAVTLGGSAAAAEPGRPAGAPSEKRDAKRDARLRKGQKNMDALVFIGTYTGGESKGIYACRMNLAKGTLEFTGQAAEAKNPSFLAIRPDRRYLYAVSEIDQVDGRPTGALSSYAVEPKTGALTFLNQQLSHGTHPCHVCVDATGKYVFVANYSSGSVAMLPIEKDGRLSEASDVAQHKGTSVNKARQEGPHAHSVTLDPANRYAFAADLGIDKVMIYRLDLEKGKLIPNDPPFAPVKPGSGPRHFAFHPSAKYAYLINEMGSTMIAFAYNASKGSLTEIQTVSTLPEGWQGTNYCADVHVHPSGRFVYGSNRGHDTIVIYAIDPATGRLKLRGHESTRGKTPRNFAIDPTGKFLLAANQDTDNIVIFRIDQKTGLLSATGAELRVPKPVCVRFMP